MKEKIIQHSKPTVGEEEAKAVADVIKSGYISQGEKVRELEEELSRFVGAKDAVAVNSGSSALHLGLLAMGIKGDDEILLPSFVCTAPLNVIYMSGAQPRICDIESDTFNISAGSVEDNRKENTRAAIVPHMFGNPADIEKIEGSGIAVIEDCAQALGAEYGSRKAGSMGRFSIMSFYANKMIACGEGGALLSDDEDLIRAARDRRDYDNKDDYKLRYNYKMTDMQAAMGSTQLKKLPAMIKKRKDIAARYDGAFRDLDVIMPRGEFDHIYYRYVIKIKKDVKETISRIREQGINCERPIYKPLHRYLELRSGFRNTDEAYSAALSVPIYPSLTEEEQERVISAVKCTV